MSTCRRTLTIGGTVPYWQFEAASGDWYNQSANLTIGRGSFVTDTGKSGNGMRGDNGINNSGDIRTGPAFNATTTNGVSIWFWFRHVAAVGQSGNFTLIFGQYGAPLGLRFLLQRGNFAPEGQGTYVYFTADMSAHIASVFLPFTTDWFFVCGVYDKSAAKVRLYVNALTVNEVATGLLTTSQTLNINLLYNYIGYAVLDELGIVTDTAISAAQVASLYNGGSGVTWPAVSSIVTF